MKLKLHFVPIFLTRILRKETGT